MAPLLLTAIVLSSRLIDLVGQVVAPWQSGNYKAMAGSLLQEQGATKLGDLYREVARATPALLAGVGKIFAILSDAGIKSFLFVLLVYGFFMRGRQLTTWIAAASPLGRKPTRELMKTYAETGRGILVGVFAVVILHGIVASIGYSIIGIARAVELGALTAVAGMVPAVGTALVWVPLAVVLALTGHVKQAIFVVVVGLIVGSVDNLLRPWLSRLGRMPLAALPMFVAFFGGIATLGPAGVLLGPAAFRIGQARDRPLHRDQTVSGLALSSRRTRRARSAAHRRARRLRGCASLRHPCRPKSSSTREARWRARCGSDARSCSACSSRRRSAQTRRSRIRRLEQEGAEEGRRLKIAATRQASARLMPMTWSVRLVLFECARTYSGQNSSKVADDRSYERVSYSGLPRSWR